MASENYAMDEFESWMTFSPKQRPLELSNEVSSFVLEKSSSNNSSEQSSCASPFASGCRSPDKDYTGNSSPSSPSFNQRQQHLETFIPNIGSAFVPPYSLWYNPILGPSLDSSQNFLNDDLKREWRNEAKSSNPGTLSQAQRKRREQNRAAQRNFRQRKEVHLKHLETTIVNAEAQRNSLQQDNKCLHRELARLGIENNRLRRGPTCSKRDCATRRRSQLDSPSSGKEMCDKNSGKTMQVKENEKTIKLVVKAQTNKDSQDSIAQGINSPFKSVQTSVDENNKSEHGEHLPSQVDDDDNNPESPASCDSSTNSTLGSIKTKFNANSRTNSSCTTTSSTSRTGSLSNMSCETSSDSLYCDDCNRQRSSKEKFSQTKTKDAEYDSSARVLICAQEALKNIQSHELFQKGFVDIEQLLCALRQIVRYYEGTAVFDQTELESIIRECAKSGQSDELILNRF